MTLLQLRNEDARVVYLATVYHLGRPGSETDPETLQRHDLGLQSVHDEMQPRLEQAVVELDLSPYQLMRLGEALLGVSNEMKQYGIAGGHSAVPRFTETISWLFPETREDPGIAMDLVQRPVMLRHRLGAALEDAQAQVEQAREEQAEQRKAERGSWWQVWKRG